MGNEFTEKIAKIISKINEKNPYAFIGIILIVILLLDYFLIMQFQLGALNSLNPKIAELSQQVKTINGNVQRMPQYQKDVARMSMELEKINSKIKTKAEIPLLLENISRLANENNVEIEQIMPDKSVEDPVLKNKEGQYFFVPIMVVARSSYHNFGRFLNQLETGGDLFSIPEFSIVANEATVTKHSIQLTINAIVFEKSGK